MYSAELRACFLDFFQKKGHASVPSAPLVPQYDPTLLFTSAGMVPFKDFFTGTQIPPYPSATSSQKCVRAGGKHNDLEQVGHTQRHHTFFEMLGNFSFGDYFKEAAILYAWEFLTKILKLDKNRLWITVYHTDADAVQLWKKIAGLSDDRIIRIATSDNFWSAGETGPCGPCSEIFYDHGAHLFGGLPGTPDEDGDRYVELWNLVFMQFDQTAPDQRIPLPSPSIDTGMGLERIAAVMQGVSDNFETDIFKAIIQHSQMLCHSHGVTDHPHHRIAHRVIADHLRSSSFLLAEGVLPSNEGRGYVVRRILRRALRHVHYLGGVPQHLALLVPTLIEKMGMTYPELGRTKDLIVQVLSQEGAQFNDLLHKGLRQMDRWLEKATSGDIFPGKSAFTLYDTFGFPLDLTQDILKEKGFSVNTADFEQHMNAQKEQSRACWSGSGSCAKIPLWENLNQNQAPTSFSGYAHHQCNSTTTCLFIEDSPVMHMDAGQTGYVLTRESPFYPESGGQKGDIGTITWPGGQARVLDTLKKGHLIVHHVHITEGRLQPDQSVHLTIDPENRRNTTAHHSATHLLQAALREILGKHVMQKGSLVGPDKLRFDFSHSGPVSWEDLCAVENRVNDWIMRNIPVCADMLDKEAALNTGAMAFFGEQYDDIVRVISMGDASKELCGGTHVQRTGDIGLFKVLGESGVASGIRRIEATVGLFALSIIQKWQDQLRHLAQRLKTSIPQLSEKIEHILSTQNAQKPTTSSAISCIKENLPGCAFWHAHIKGSTIKDLKSKIDEFKNSIGSGCILLTTQEDDKMSIVLGVTSNLDNLNASDILRDLLTPLGIKSGGRKDLAQGGGKDLPHHDKLVQMTKEILLGGDKP
jgi:alanyl-tRNA synthetase